MGEMKKIRVGISSCLLGEPVRYDGGHKRDRCLAGTMGGIFEYVPVCPEFEAGLGVPREAMHLEDGPAGQRLITHGTGIDLTARMDRRVRVSLRALEREDLCGFIFKCRSPSCGVERVKVIDEKGRTRPVGSGLFARAFMDRFPLVPVEDEERLNAAAIRDNFIVRVFALGRWKEQVAADRRPAAIIGFHARHKYLLMAHSPAILKEMGKLVAGVRSMKPGDFLGKYGALFMRALAFISTTKKNANVLAHMAGYLRGRIGADEKKELGEIIEQYRKELVPLIVPVTLIRHYARKCGETYLADQYYLDPHPLELKLRNHA